MQREMSISAASNSINGECYPSAAAVASPHTIHVTGKAGPVPRPLPLAAVNQQPSYLLLFLFAFVFLHLRQSHEHQAELPSAGCKLSHGLRHFQEEDDGVAGE